MNKLWIKALLITPIFLLGLYTLVTFSETQNSANKVIVYKDASCGCCNKWVDHLTMNGFQVDAHDTTDLMKIKAEHKVPNELSSCHTALVDGYVVEGHVPADVIKRLLTERPDVIGITVPGMPVGSPGMEGSYVENYDILTFDKEGKTTVYASR